MSAMHGWEFAIWGIAACVAISALVQLMLRKQNELTREFLAQAEAEQRERQAAEMKAEQATKKRKPA